MRAGCFAVSKNVNNKLFFHLSLLIVILGEILTLTVRLCVNLECDHSNESEREFLPCVMVFLYRGLVSPLILKAFRIHFLANK